MTDVIAYLRGEQLQVTEEELRKLAKTASKRTMIGSKLYKRGFSTPLLRCVTLGQAEEIVREIHEGDHGSHIGGQALAAKITRAGYY